jgi:P-type Mg2+ transporter
VQIEQDPIGALYAKFNTSEAGLTSEEAERRLAEFGPNEPAHERHIGGFLQFIRFFANPLVIILLIASAVSAAVGELVNASIIAGMVLLSVALNVLQTYRSHRAVERLRAGIVLTATACRDRSWIEIPRSDLVPGDVIRLSAGDLVPADARLIQAKDLHVQEAALTGESLPIEKEAGDRARSAEKISNLIYLGTSVVSGTATALVIATGASTAFGDIAARLAARPSRNRVRAGHAAVRFLDHEDRCLLGLVRFSR